MARAAGSSSASTRVDGVGPRPLGRQASRRCSSCGSAPWRGSTREWRGFPSARRAPQARRTARPTSTSSALISRLSLRGAHRGAERGDPVDGLVADIPDEREHAPAGEHAARLRARAVDVDPMPRLTKGDAPNGAGGRRKFLGGSHAVATSGSELRERGEHRGVGVNRGDGVALSDDLRREFAGACADVERRGR